MNKMITISKDEFISLKERLAELESINEQLQHQQIEHNNTKEALQKERDQAQLYLNIAGVMIIALNAEGNIILINKRGCTILGYNEEEIIGKNWFKVFLPKVVSNEVFGVFQQLMTGDITPVEYYENPVLTKNGEQRIIAFNNTVLYDSSSKIIGALCSGEDITERKMTEKALRDSEERFRRTFDQSPIGVAIVTLDSRFARVNEAFCRILGYSEEELIGSSVFEITHPDHVATDKEQVQRLRNGELDQYITDKRYVRKDGSIVWGHLSVGLIKDEAGSPLYFLPMIEDITQRKNAEEEVVKRESMLKEQNEEYLALNEELNRTNLRIQKINEELTIAKEKAEESDKLKSAFLANLSHEVRTPMNGIMGYVDLLRHEENSSEKHLRYIDQVYRSSKRLLRIINDILDISKIEAGQLKLHNEEVSLNKILDRLNYFYANDNNKQKDIKLIVRKGLTDEDSYILTDSSRIEQIISNLLDNAFKFTSKGYIEFGYQLIDKTIELYVKDTGIGISEDKQRIIFERFRQVEDTLTRPQGGNGLGLSISKGLVELMSGKIWVQSTVGVGSVFFVSIPYKTEKTLKNNEINSESQLKRLKGKVILLVEDDKFSTDYFREILMPAQVQLIHTQSGFEAIKICSENNRIELVLMDIRLNDLSGLEAAKKIKQINPKLPIIAQTAYVMPEDKNKCLRSGCDEYLSKPINAAHLFELLQKYLVD